MLSLLQAERDKIQSDDLMTRAGVEMSSLDRSLSRLEQENLELRQRVQTLQTQLSQTDNDHTRRSVAPTDVTNAQIKIKKTLKMYKNVEKMKKNVS